MTAVFSALAGLLCGVISGFGIGGGSLLMIYMTAIAAVQQRTAQGINLLYFLPTAAASLIVHAKNRFVKWKLVWPAAICGCLFGAGAAFLSSMIGGDVLRKIFGGFLLLVGLTELLAKKKA